MDKSYYFNDKNVLAENEQYLLRKQLSEDKEVYYNLFSEISIIKGRMKENMFRKYFEKIWVEEQNEDAIRVSINWLRGYLTPPPVPRTCPAQIPPPGPSLKPCPPLPGSGPASAVYFPGYCP